MGFYRGKVLDGERVVFEGVEVNLTLLPGLPDGSGQWWGDFVLPPAEDLDPGLYRLVLDDGRAGEIDTELVRDPGGRRPSVSFKGSGPLR